MRTLIVHFQPVFLEDNYHSGSPQRNYAYAYCGPKNVKKGDHAIVHNGTNFGIVQVVRVIPGIDSKVTKTIIEVLTQEEFASYQERNQKIDDLRSSIDELDYRLEQHKKLDKYEELAKTDSRAAEILGQIRATFGLGPQEPVSLNGNTAQPTSAT